jgi:hypothetical protein
MPPSDPSPLYLRLVIYPRSDLTAMRSYVASRGGDGALDDAEARLVRRLSSEAFARSTVAVSAPAVAPAATADGAAANPARSGTRGGRRGGSPGTSSVLRSGVDGASGVVDMDRAIRAVLFGGEGQQSSGSSPSSSSSTPLSSASSPPQMGSGGGGRSSTSRCREAVFREAMSAAGFGTPIVDLKVTDNSAPGVVPENTGDDATAAGEGRWPSLPAGKSAATRAVSPPPQQQQQQQQQRAMDGPAWSSMSARRRARGGSGGIAAAAAGGAPAAAAQSPARARWFARRDQRLEAAAEAESRRDEEMLMSADAAEIEEQLSAIAHSIGADVRASGLSDADAEEVERRIDAIMARLNAERLSEDEIDDLLPGAPRDHARVSTSYPMPGIRITTTVHPAQPIPSAAVVDDDAPRRVEQSEPLQERAPVSVAAAVAPPAATGLAPSLGDPRDSRQTAMEASSILKKRRTKMNKHKRKKLRRKDRMKTK